jgi:hypothetical protein
MGGVIRGLGTRVTVVAAGLEFPTGAFDEETPIAPIENPGVA